jgi:hypothetical protein
MMSLFCASPELAFPASNFLRAIEVFEEIQHRTQERLFRFPLHKE